MTFLLISHTPYSSLHGFHQRGMGEIQNALKLKRLIEEAGFGVHEVVDAYELFGQKKSKEAFDRLASLNYDLAEQGLEIIEEFAHPDTLTAQRHLEKYPKETLVLFLSYDRVQAALMGAGIHKRFPTAQTVYVPHLDAPFLPTLFRPSPLLITECLAANVKAIEAGFSKGRMLYMPHSFPTMLPKPSCLKSYLKKISGGKSVNVSKDIVVTGMVSRFKQGKNIEYALKAFDAIADKVPHALFLLKGGYDERVEGTMAFEKELLEVLQWAQTRPWFFWDKEYSSFEEALEIYTHFDLYLHPSGIDYANNTVVELLALGKCCLVLEEQTQPYLFKGGVVFIPPAKESLPWHRCRYFVPDHEVFSEKLLLYLQNRELREVQGKRAREIALQRFAPECTTSRLPLLAKALHAFHFKTGDEKKYEKRLEEQLTKDLELYDL